MKIYLVSFLFLLAIGGFQDIAEINSHVQNAEADFRRGNFAAAVKGYEFVVYGKNQKKPALLLNLAHAYLKDQQPEKAQKVYEQCAKGENPFFRSIAWEQLGTLQTKLPDYQKALTFYKRALIANPENEQARFNYEMLKKYLRENPEKQNQIPPPAPEKKEKQDEKQPQPKDKEKQPKQNKPDPNGNQEQETQDQQEKGDQQQKPEKETDPESQNKPEQEKPNGEPGQDKKQSQGEEEGKEKGENLAENEEKAAPKTPNKSKGKENASGNEQRLQTQYERLRKANISPEKANMMLEAMKNAEQQYLQQLPKKPTKKPDRSKPNW